MKTCSRCSFVVALNEFISFFIVTIRGECGQHAWIRPRLEVVDNSAYAEQLYLRVRNDEVPQRGDATEARSRQLTCNDITNADYFLQRNEYAVDEETVRQTLKAEYKMIYKMLYKWRRSSLSLFVQRSLSRRGRIYKNPYVFRRFHVRRNVSEDERMEDMFVSDYVFVCLTTGNHIKDINAYFVTKEYNLMTDPETSQGDQHQVGRFIFSQATREFEALAEEAAWALVNPDFQVELHYLKTRKRFRPVPTRDITLDPVCRMTFDEFGFNDQWMRLCKTALGSLYFKTKVKHPRKWDGESPCALIEVSFRTDEAKRQVETQQKKYHEWMVPCQARTVKTDTEVYYFISRAYATNRVFVYGVDASQGTVYLENLSTNIRVEETEYVRLRNQRSRGSQSSSGTSQQSTSCSETPPGQPTAASPTSGADGVGGGEGGGGGGESSGLRMSVDSSSNI